MHVLRTHVDIAMEVSSLCTRVSNLTQAHYDLALVVAGYLVSTKSLGIVYGGRQGDYK